MQILLVLALGRRDVFTAVVLFIAATDVRNGGCLEDELLNDLFRYD